MTKRFKMILAMTLILCAFATAAMALCPIGPTCPIHDYMIATYVGTQFVDGVMVGEYKCPRGHTFYVRCQ